MGAFDCEDMTATQEAEIIAGLEADDAQGATAGIETYYLISSK